MSELLTLLRIIGGIFLFALAAIGWVAPVSRVLVAANTGRSISLRFIAGVFVVGLAVWGGAMGLVGALLYGSPVQWLLPLAPLPVVAWWLSRVIRSRRLWRVVRAGGDLTPAHVTYARRRMDRAEIAAALLQLHRAQRAIEVLDGLPPLRPREGYWLVEAHLARGNRDDAEDAARAVEGDAPDVGKVARARLLIAGGDAAAALRHLDAEEPDDAWHKVPDHRWHMVHLARADALVMLGRTDDARKAIDDAQKIASFDVLAYVQAVDRPSAALAQPTPYR